MTVAKSIALFALAALLEMIALGAYGFVATLQPDSHFGRILAAYAPDRWDVIGAVICLLGVAVIMYAPR